MSADMRFVLERDNLRESIRGLYDAEFISHNKKTGELYFELELDGGTTITYIIGLSYIHYDKTNPVFADIINDVDEDGEYDYDLLDDVIVENFIRDLANGDVEEKDLDYALLEAWIDIYL